MNTIPLAIAGPDTAQRIAPSLSPSPFAEMASGRVKQPLGDLFGLKNFGVIRCALAPASISALQHRHAAQDQFIYLPAGKAKPVTEEGEMVLTPGMCAGFAAGGRTSAGKPPRDRSGVAGDRPTLSLRYRGPCVTTRSRIR